MASALDLAINLTASGVSSVQGGLHQVGQAMNGVTDEITDARERTKELEEQIAKARRANDIPALNAASAQLASHLQSAGAQAAQLQQRLAGMREAGAKMAAAGGAGLLLAQGFINADKEGAATEARLESIFKAQKRISELPQAQAAIQTTIETGHFDAEGALDVAKSGALMASMNVSTKDMEAALPRIVALARSAGEESSEAFADSWADGYNLLELAPLESAKIYFSKAENEAFEKFKETAGEAAARVRFMEMFLQKADKTAGSLADSLTEAQAAANDMSREGHKAAENVGKGAAEAKKSVDELAGSILAAANASPELQQSAGYALYLGSCFTSAAGSVISLGGQIGLLRLGFPSLAATASTSFASITASAGIAGASITALLAPLALATAAIAGLWVAWQGSKDASSMSDEALKSKWGPLGDFWVSASGSDQDQGATQEDRDAYEMAKRSGLTKGKSFEEWRGSSIDNTPTPKADPMAEAKAKADAVLADVSSKLGGAVPAAAPPATAAPAPTTSLPTVTDAKGAKKDAGAGVTSLDLFSMLTGVVPGVGTVSKAAPGKAAAAGGAGSKTSASGAPAASDDVVAALGFVKSGGSILDFDRAAKAGASAGAAGAKAGASAASGPTEVSVPIRSSGAVDESGSYVIRFVADPIRLPNPVAAAARPR